MKTLWFKQEFVEPIRQGEKTSTLRRRGGSLRPGDIVQCQVGPRKPFAIIKIGRMRRKRLSCVERQMMQQIYAEEVAAAVRVDFELWGDQPDA
jgi:hypothetical protein